MNYNNQLQSECNIITVTSDGLIQVKPNILIISLGVTTENVEAKLAQADNASKTAIIFNALKQLGISESNLKTTSYQLNVIYDYEDGKQTFSHYEVSHLFEVKIDNIDKAGTIIDSAINNGASVVTNLNFTIDNEEYYYNQALKQALENAERKASILTNSLQVKMNKIPVTITEVTTTNKPLYFQAETLTKTSATEISPGQIEIKASVKVVYNYSL